MLDKLIDLLLGIWRSLIPFTVILHWKRAVVLRFGRFHRELDPGLHWVIPFGVEQVFSDNVNTRTTDLPPQSLVTLDGRSIVVSGVVTSNIYDIQKSLLFAETVDQALRDSCLGAIAEYVAVTTWGDLRKVASNERLTRACANRAVRYGQTIEMVQLSDISPSRSLRLWMDKA